MAEGYNPGAYGGEIYIGHPNYAGSGSAGSNYYHAISGVGEDIAKAMMYYHQQHVNYDQKYQVADALSRIGISPDGSIVPIQMDEKGKPLNKDIRPIIDKKSLQLFQANNQSQRVANTAALDALGRLGMKQLDRALNQALSDRGLTGDLKRARIGSTNARQTQIRVQTAKTLGLLPDVPKPPTGSELLRQQRAQQKSLFDQQSKLADRLTNQKVGGQGINDPQMLLDDKNILFGQRDSFGRFYEKTDDKDIQYARIVGGKDDGSDLDIPIKQFDRLRNNAEQWQQLGQQAQGLQQSHQLFNQTWGSLDPKQQQIALQKLADPRKFMTPLQVQAAKDAGLTPDQIARADFDSKFGKGSYDLVTGAQSAQPQPSVTPTPADTGTVEDIDTSGEEETPDTDTEPSDTGQ